MKEMKKPMMMIDGGLPKWRCLKATSNSGFGFMWNAKPKFTSESTRARVKTSWRKTKKLTSETPMNNMPFLL
jgi:hypothetical protein